MHIWLINPPVKRDEPTKLGAVIENLFFNSPPLGLLSLAAVLEEAGHRVTVTDSPVHGLTARGLGNMAPGLQPDLVGFTATTSYHDIAVQGAHEIKRTMPHVPVCIGGPHFNAHPDFLVRYPDFDFGVRGEGEYTLRDIVTALEGGGDVSEIPGVVTAREGEVHFAPFRPPVEDLDDLPFPARHLVDLSRYRPLPNDEKLLPKSSLIGSRGCPFSCIFCDKATFGKSYRARSPVKVVEEMHILAKEHGVKDIAIVDSTFTPNKRRLLAMLDAMEANPPPASWTCSCRANLLDEESLRRMKALGCWKIRIAIESGNDEILKRIRKGISLAQFRQTVTTAARLGFQVKAFFMLGHLGETEQTMKDTLDFALSLPLSDATIQITTPLRGTPLFEECEKHGTLLSHDDQMYSFFQPVFIPEGLTAEDLEAAHRRFYRRFYLRPSLMWRNLKHARRLKDVTKYFRAVPLVFNVMFTNQSSS